MKATLISLITNYGLLITLAVFLLFFRLGSTTLTNWDEAWFASVAADMAQRRDFLVGHWNGQVWFYEPPMLTWVLAGMITMFGKQEFWLRSFNALCGLLTVLLSMRLAHKVSGSRLTGFLTGVILLSDIEFLFRSRQINAEVPVTFFLLAALASVIVASKTGRIRWVVSTGLFLGLAFLTKRASPVLAIPAILYALTRSSHPDVIARSLRRDNPERRDVPRLAEGSHTILRRNTEILRFVQDGASVRLPRSSAASDLAMTLKSTPSKRLFILLIAFLITAFPWFLYQYWRFGDQFIDEFFIGYTFGKIRTVNLGAGISPLFYLSAIKHALKIWSLLVPIAVAWAVLVSRKKQEYRVLLMYAATFFFALTAASIKSSWFLLPIHPILAIMIGSFLTTLGTRMGRIGSFTLILALLTVSTIQLFFYRHQFIVPDTTSHQMKLVEQASLLVSEDKPLYLDDEYLPVAVFYSDRRVIPLRFNRGQPIINLDVPVGSIVLSNQETIDRFREHIGLPLETIGEERDLLLLRVGSGKNQESEEEESGKREV